nr:hypothetical protein [Tengunoibacter tsumagoiensis]
MTDKNHLKGYALVCRIVERYLRIQQTARDFLLNLHHADIPFCFIVVKENRTIMKKGQDLILVRTQTIQQAPDDTPFLGSSFSACGHREVDQLNTSPYRSYA